MVGNTYIGQGDEWKDEWLGMVGGKREDHGENIGQRDEWKDEWLGERERIMGNRWKSKVERVDE